ncbi:S8 family peptidase [Ferrimonas balearica]|uniref:S8 family serine peptidase n=1 Tax=Ferrimonas balearica TaxID=44012 RepID=UPI001C97E2FD|nr:S8 family peptidase [Ferrimonas balearica]
MNIKSVAMMVASALYSAGTLAGAQGTDEQVPTTIDAMALYQHQQQAQAQKAEQQLSPLRRDGLANIPMVPKSAKEKFAPEERFDGTAVYIVQLQDAPVATYDGRLPGLAATRPALQRQQQGQKLFGTGTAGTSGAAISAYTNHLLSAQQELIQQVQGQVRRQFTTAINALSIEMTQQEAMRLAQMPEVAFVQRSRNYELHTDIGPEHVGAPGIWEGTTSHDGGRYTGAGMVVGIIDTGINTRHPSFAAVGGDGYVHTNPRGTGNYLGDCALAEYADRCNDKLIGLYTHDSITGEYGAASGAEPVGEDYNGHGSHVASTVAGNVLYDVDVVAPEFGGGAGIPMGVAMPRISGVAPHANLISYQVCHPVGGCPGEAMLFAIEQAIKDGVDVINMSIGGSESFPWDDAFEMAFLSAREAGVAVALSAGNAGASRGTDSIYTVDHTSPWVLNVAATTHARSIAISGKALEGLSGGDESLNPGTIEGAGISPAFTGEFVLAADFGDARCNSPFAPGTFLENHIVVCERGDIARIEKAVNVRDGGAGGFVLYNTWDEGDEVADDTYVIPGIHLTAEQYYGDWNTPGLLPWLQSGTGLSGTISASQVDRVVNPEDADWLASFSSRGPSSTVEELFSPGIAAPGVDIFAAWTETNPFDPYGDTRAFNAISGTSMASPHVAGMMTLIRQANPQWTAAEVQSALQMTADSLAIKTPYPIYPYPIKVAGIFRAGHGLANVERALNAGLVMDESADNFRRANPHNGGRVRDLNLPQMINNDCGRVCSWTRTVRATRDGSWAVESVAGEEHPLFWDYALDPTAKVTITPNQFTLKAGESVDLTVSVAFSDIDLAWYDGAYHHAFGEIQFNSTDGRSPGAYWPYLASYAGKALPNSIEVLTHSEQGQQVVPDVPLGVPAGALTAEAYEPVPAEVHQVALPRLQSGAAMVDSEGFWNTELDNVRVFDVTVAEDTALLRAEVFGRLSSSIDDPLNHYADVDLWVLRDYDGDGRLHLSEAICASQLPQTSKGEYCSIEHPEPGTYKVLLANYILYPWENVDTYEFGIVTLGKSPGQTLTTRFDSNAANPKHSDITIEWHQAPEPGQTLYSAVAVQVEGAEPGSVIMMPVNLHGGEPLLTADASQSAARVGEIVELSVLTQANRTGQDRMVDLAVTLPDGLALIPGSLPDLEGLVTTETGLQWQGVQADTSATQAHYQVSTNLDNPQCRTPWAIDYPDGEPLDGKFVDLTRFGFAPSWGTFYEENEWGWGSWVHDVEIPTFANDFQPFDNGDYFRTDKVVLSSRGWVQADYLQYNPWDIGLHQVQMPMPGEDYGIPPDFVLAPWHNARLDPLTWEQEWTLSMYAPHWDPALSSGVYIAYYDHYTLLSWKGAQTHDKSWDMDWNEVVAPRDDRYDFQMFMREHSSHDEGQFEVIMAYDNLDFGSQDGNGVIGLRGYWGPRAGYNPLYGHSGVAFAEDNLKAALSDGLVVCYDIVNDATSQVQLAFQVEVTDAAYGSEQRVDVEAEVGGVGLLTESTTIAVAANILVKAISDQEVEENGVVEGIPVHYSDSDGGVSPNIISVTGEHITAVVHGHRSGDTFDLVPAPDWYGETEVTVTVSDQVNPNDQHSVSFTLTVLSDGVDPAPEPEPEAPKSDSGSFGWFSLLLLGLLAGRRRH